MLKQPISVVDGGETTVYGCDTVGQVFSRDGPWTDDTVSYSYDKGLRPGLNVASDFAYDGKLRRRARFESKWVSGAWVTKTVVRYVYDGNLMVHRLAGER